ncbi:ZC3H3 protein, partial [Agelaius phoeniceus]|nr:ZC3H3 protein [Agelaius phoeniceus]
VSGSTSESAVALKSEPQKPLEFPGQEPAQHSVRIRAEPLSPGQPNGEEVQDASLHPKLFGNAETLSRPAQAGVTLVKSRFPVIPKAPALQKAASAPISSKSQKFRKNNYTWVANPGKSSRIVKRWASPRAENSKKGIGGVDKGAKISPKADLGAKIKKLGLQSKLGVSPSKYKGTPSTRPGCSKPHPTWPWTLHRDGAATASLGIPSQPLTTIPGRNFFPVSHLSLPSGCGSHSLSPTDKKNISPTTALKSLFHLRRKNSTRGKPLVTVKRSSPRGLVQISKHCLCRVPATRTQAATKEGSNFHDVRSPPANKVIKTRYRIVKKNMVPPALSSFTSPIPTWKTRRPITSR